MKHLLPVLIFLLVVGSVIAIFKYKESTSVESINMEPVAKVDKVRAGDPDGTVDDIVEAAVAESGESALEDEEELSDVTADITEASSVGDVYSENEY